MSTPVLEAPVGESPQLPEVTPEQLLAMPDGHRYELVDGKLVERNMGAISSRVALRIMALVDVHARQHRLGRAYGSDCGYQCFARMPKKIRYPDGSFIAAGRLGDTPSGFIKIAPDLALEVVSPNDTAEEIEEKRREYLAAGVLLFWVVYPENRSVHVHRPQGSHMLEVGDELTGADVLPEFRCRVAELFEDL